ncbi:MAG: RidA family protein [bacterium]
MRIESKLKDMGIDLPIPGPSEAKFVPALRVGNFIYTSGQTSREATSGEAYLGKVGKDLSVDDGYRAARLCAIRCLGAIKSIVGDLDRVRRVVKVLGFVNHAEGFTEQSQVMNGASDLLVELFGEAGKHTRAAIGVYGLPGGAAVEIEMIVEVED